MNPPRAGPATVAICIPIVRNAMAPGSSWVGTSVGGSARAAGLPIAFATPVAAASATKGQSLLVPARVTATSTAITAMLSRSAPANTSRRGKRSARCPAGSASRGSGTKPARPIRPRSKALWRMSYTCQPTITPAIWLPSPIASDAAQSRAKSLCCKAGGTRRLFSAPFFMDVCGVPQSGLFLKRTCPPGGPRTLRRRSWAASARHGQVLARNADPV